MSHLRELQKKLLADGDGALISSDTNQYYLCGFHFSDGYILVLPHKAYLLTDFRYLEAAQAAVTDKDFEILTAERGMIAELASLVHQNGVRRLYLEEATLSLSMRDRLEREMEGVVFCKGTSAAILELRQFKTPEELAKIEEAQRITDAAFAHFLKVYRRDMTEVEVALELEFFMRRAGAQGIAFDTIAVSGSASSLPHGTPQNRPLEEGFLTMDFGARVDGYCADMTRTVVIGKADADMKRLYATVLNAQRAALDYLGEGTLCREADAVARRIIDDAGYQGCFGHSLGHGVGMFVHEAPRLAASADEDARLCRGHVVTVEPGIYIMGKYGCRIEDMVAVTHTGDLYNFTKSSKELIELD